MPFSAGLYRTISYQNASSKPEQSLISSSLRIASCCFVCSESCCVSYHIFETLFVLYICNFSYYIFATFRIIYLQLSYYIFATFRIIFLELFVLYICNFRIVFLQLFVLYICNFRIIFLQLFVLYICNFSYYIFATFRIIHSTLFVLYNPFRTIKSHFRIIKLGYVLKNLCSYCK